MGWCAKLILLFFPFTLLADTASVISGTGGNISLAPHEHIRMLHEKITIRAHQHFAEFEIIYTFENIANTTQYVSMGFPQKKEALEGNLFNFKAFDKNLPLQTTLHVSPPDEKFDWHLYKTVFAPKEIKTFKNSYWVYPTHYRGLYSLEYILHTGSSWKGEIRALEIDVFLEDSFVFSPEHLKTYEFEIKPKGYIINEAMNHLSWRITNLKPSKKDDLSILFVRKGAPFGVRSDTASSTLTIDNLYGEYYGTENVLDGDLATAWGTSSKLKGEWIRVDFERPLSRVGKIGIFPGLGPDLRFVNADQLKEATLLFSDGSEQRIYFEQKPIMQFFKVDKKNVAWVKLRIEETYEGLLSKEGYKGTAYVSELHFYD